MLVSKTSNFRKRITVIFGHLHIAQRLHVHHFLIRHELCGHDPFDLLSIMGWRHQCDIYSDRRLQPTVLVRQTDAHFEQL